MVTEEITVTVKVTKVGIRLMKVIRDNGYQLVCGGRLVSERKNGATVPHPDLPEYTPAQFPDWEAWAKAQGDARVEAPAVTVQVQRDGLFVPCGSPRVAAYLFGVHPKADVAAWIRKEATR